MINNSRRENFFAYSDRHAPVLPISLDTLIRVRLIPGRWAIPDWLREARIQAADALDRDATQADAVGVGLQ